MFLDTIVANSIFEKLNKVIFNALEIISILLDKNHFLKRTLSLI